MPLRLLLHVDKPPQLVQVEDVAPIAYRTGPAEPNTVDYEDVGKVWVTIEADEFGSPLEVAMVRMFMHPDLMDSIRGGGERKTLSPNYS